MAGRKKAVRSRRGAKAKVDQQDDQTERPDLPDRLDQIEQTEQIEHVDQADQVDRVEVDAPSSPSPQISQMDFDDQEEVYTVFEIIAAEDDDDETGGHNLYYYSDGPDVSLQEMTLNDDHDDSKEPTEDNEIDGDKPESPPTVGRAVSEEEAKTEPSADSSSSSGDVVRRSSRIKTINVLKQRSKGRGLVNKHSDSKSVRSDGSNDSPTGSPGVFSSSSTASLPPADPDAKPVKVKSRWRRSSEMEMGGGSPATPPLKLSSPAEDGPDERDVRERLAQFQHISENEYHCERTVSKEARKMTCDCFLTKEEIENGEFGCGDDCLNRLLMIECNSRCPIGDRCTNRRFQKHSNSELKVIKTEKKGLGIQAVKNIKRGEFLMEYVGEVLNWDQFSERAQEYSSDKNKHHYFMFLKGDAVIDATLRGNISRFINHSCDPNAETQKWTVNGDLRIGFFSKKDIKAGEEITFDYQFQRYGKEGLRCFCEASNCRGWIGEEPESSEEEDEAEPEQEEEESKEEALPDQENLDAVEQPVKSDSVDKDENKVDSSQNKVESQVKKVQRKPRKPKIRKPKAKGFNELLQDMDLEEEIKNLTRCGIKNQSHTLSLCRAMVRAKQSKEQISLLKLLASADLPCRRLFLDYRGLRLLAPWCDNADAIARLEILAVLEKLPISNKTVLKETKILSNVEKWLTEAQIIANNVSSDDSAPGTPMLIDESTGLPIETVKMTDLKTEKIENKKSTPMVIHTDNQKESILNLSKTLISSWSSLQEAFKIPKKERIELMKEHERQANEPKSKDTEESKDNKEKWVERYNRHHDRDKKRPITTISDVPRKSQLRIDDRILTPVPAMSKEERRKEFAARAAHQEQMRRAQSHAYDQSYRGVAPPPANNQWPTEHSQPQPAAYAPDYAAEYPQPEYMQTDYTDYSNGVYQPYTYPAAAPAPGYPYYPNQSFTPTPPLQSIPTVETPQPIPTLGSHQQHSIPTVIAMQTTPVDPRPIPSLVPPVAPTYQFEETRKDEYYSFHEEESLNNSKLSNVENENVSDVVRWSAVKLPRRWRSMKDARGRTYYYHVKYRVSQWIPPLYSPTYNSKDEDSSEDEVSDDEEAANDEGESNDEERSVLQEKFVEGLTGFNQVTTNGTVEEVQTKVTVVKKLRPGLVTERIISPRQEEDIIASRLDNKRYKEAKEKLRRRKELALAAAGCPDALNKYKKRAKVKKAKAKMVIVDPEVEEKTSKRIKDAFTVSMAKVIVHQLDPYLRPECPVGRITDTADFKHLARKLTRFVMLKELKQCRSVHELECNDSVKQKAREYVKKYMARLGPVYQRPVEETDC